MGKSAEKRNQKNGTPSKSWDLLGWWRWPRKTGVFVKMACGSDVTGREMPSLGGPSGERAVGASFVMGKAGD